MPIKCQFNLSRTSAVYYTGEQISGTITLKITKKPMQVEGISITLLGVTTTSWHEAAKDLTHIEHNDSTGPTEPIQLHYAASKTHVEQTQQLAKSLILPPGCMQLGNFALQLPNNAPGSCRLDYGTTNYSLQLTLERRSKHAKRFQHRLCIRNRIEFHELTPATIQSSTLCLNLPRSVFVPGQRVAYRLEASVPSCQFTTRLCQCISYESQQPVVKCKKVVRVLNESCNMEDSLHLPLTAPIMSRLSGEAIEIAYYLETLSDCSKPLRLPLFVGTVAPPVDNPKNCSSLGFVNFGLSENVLMCSSINQLLPHSCSREIATSSYAKHNEHLKLLRRQKKHSYVRIALQYFYKHLLPAN
ncbi:uncharacterized protein LOC117791865 [Drosophila innubila]|uniref:uncharacterized protein LOC117791865 n=1 Tax=Drosophila innubila TaxID=198719 RepID=UPI00148C803B|nr:uncharacterized protein LOC117791865 [Drosophila innubila]